MPQRLWFLPAFSFLPPVFSSPSGTRLVTEAKNAFNSGDLPVQSGNYFFSFALTKPSSSADLSCLPSGNIFLCLTLHAVSFPISHLCLSYRFFMGCPSLTLEICPVFSHCFLLTFEGVSLLPLWWVTLETSDLFTVGWPSQCWAGHCLSLLVSTGKKKKSLIFRVLIIHWFINHTAETPQLK